MRAFQSTPSAWRETIRRCNRIQPGIFQSTPSAWRETTTDYRRCRYNVISIHSLRMEGDYRSSHRRVDRCISIHSLRMEGDEKWNLSNLIIFHFNPLPPHGGRLDIRAEFTPIERISIHSLRMEGDQARRRICERKFEFQSTPSAWRETSGAVPADDLRQHFNPLPPHGGRQRAEIRFIRGRLISIHSLRMEGDPPQILERIADTDFNPLPPHGGRPETPVHKI